MQDKVKRIETINQELNKIGERHQLLVNEREQLTKEVNEARVGGYPENLVARSRELGIVPENFGDEKSLRDAVKQAEDALPKEAPEEEK